MTPVAAFWPTLIVFLFAVFRPAGAEPLKVATPGQGVLDLPIIVAMHNRYFHTAGLEIQKIQIEPETSAKALVAGQVDLSLTWEASLRAALTGAPIQAVAGLVLRPPYVLLSRPEIRSGGDLAGKIVGIDASGSMIDFVSQVAIRYLGSNQHVKVVEVGHSEFRLAALRAGEIQATAVDILTAARAEEQGFHRLVYLGDIMELPVSGVFVGRAALANQRDLVKRFLRATLRGSRFIRHERADAIRLLAGYLKLTASQAERCYDLALGAFTGDGLVADRVLAFSMRRAGEGLSSAGARPLDRVADWSLLREILAERRKVPFWLKLRPYDF